MYRVYRSEIVTYTSLSFALLASLEACVSDRLMSEDKINTILLSLPSVFPPTPPLTVPALFAAAALLSALLAAAQLQRAPPCSD